MSETIRFFDAGMGLISGVVLTFYKGIFFALLMGSGIIIAWAIMHIYFEEKDAKVEADEQ